MYVTLLPHMLALFLWCRWHRLWAQNGSSLGHVFATVKHQFLTNRTRNPVKNHCFCVVVFPFLSIGPLILLCFHSPLKGVQNPLKQELPLATFWRMELYISCWFWAESMAAATLLSRTSAPCVLTICSAARNPAMLSDTVRKSKVRFYLRMYNKSSLRKRNKLKYLKPKTLYVSKIIVNEFNTRFSKIFPTDRAQFSLLDSQLLANPHRPLCLLTWIKQAIKKPNAIPRQTY